jgi:hypothetical protein
MDAVGDGLRTGRAAVLDRHERAAGERAFDGLRQLEAGAVAGRPRQTRTFCPCAADSYAASTTRIVFK